MIQKWKSVAVWKDFDTTTDMHRTKESAEAVCRMLESDGFGGEGKIFPTKTSVELHLDNQISEPPKPEAVLQKFLNVVS